MEDKSNRQPGDSYRWLEWLFAPSMIIIGASFLDHVAIFITANIGLACLIALVSRFRTRRVMFAGSLAVLLFVGVFTFGIVGDTRSMPSAVTGMWSQQTSPLPEEHCVEVSCSEASSGKLSAYLRKGDWDKLLREWVGTDNPIPVQLTYRTQSILGISSLEPVADAIDSRLVIADREQFLRSGILGRVALPLILTLAALPLVYLVYKDRTELFGWLVRR